MFCFQNVKQTNFSFQHATHAVIEKM